MKIILLDRDENLVRCWRDDINRVEAKLNKQKVAVETLRTSLSELSITNQTGRTTIVSPGNSFGYFGGGIDKITGQLFSKDGNHKDIEPIVQHLLLEESYSPPGSAKIVKFPNEFLENTKAFTDLQADSLIHSPTMRIPEDLTKDKSVTELYRFIFDTTWSILTQIMIFNRTNLAPEAAIETVVLPGLGTGYGHVPHEICSKSIVAAITIFFMRAKPTLKSLYILRFMNQKNYNFINESYAPTLPKTPFNVLNDNLDKLF